MEDWAPDVRAFFESMQVEDEENEDSEEGEDLTDSEQDEVGEMVALQKSDRVEDELIEEEEVPKGVEGTLVTHGSSHTHVDEHEPRKEVGKTEDGVGEVVVGHHSQRSGFTKMNKEKEGDLRQQPPLVWTVTKKLGSLAAMDVSFELGGDPTNQHPPLRPTKLPPLPKLPDPSSAMEARATPTA